jgi:hypothetical protein
VYLKKYTCVFTVVFEKKKYTFLFFGILYLKEYKKKERKNKLTFLKAL